jgi:hypothetical protein
MEERDKHIDTYFAKLGGYTEQPPAEVWAALEQRLDKPRKKRAIWWWLCLLAGVAGGTLLYAVKQKNATEIPTAIAITAQANTHITDATAIPTTTTTTTAPFEPANASTPTYTAKHKHPTNQKARQAQQQVPANPITPVAAQEQIITMTTEAEDEKTWVASTTNIATAAPETVNTPSPKPLEPDYLTLAPSAGKQGKSTTEPPVNHEQYIALLPQAGKPAVKTQPIEKVQPQPATLVPQASPNKTTSNAEKVDMPAMQPNSAKTTELKIIAAPAKVATETKPNIVSDAPQNKKKNSRWEMGMKLGYEGGTRHFSTSALTVAPYIQYALNSRLSLMTQPTFKYTWIQKYIISNDNFYRHIDTSREYVQPKTFTPSGFLPRFAYNEWYDSIVARQYVTNSRFFSADLPLMLSYKLKPKFSIYGGVNLNFTKIGIVTDEKWYNIKRTDTLDAFIPSKPIVSNAGVDFDTLWVSQVFEHSAKPYSTYNAAAQQGGTASPFRLGVTFGVSYAYKQRLLFDIRYRQNVTGLSVVPNAIIRRLYSQPYFNVSMGYRIFK